MDIWITSDQHFGHRNIIKFCNRPFKTIERGEDGIDVENFHVDEMDETLVDNYNSLVKPNDIVYHLGDFGFNTHIAKRLHGRKHLIIGNHDWKLIDKLRPHFLWCRDTFQLKVDGITAWLAHYPHRSWPSAFHGAYHFFGHVHGKLPPHGRSCDVGVDVWDYKPVNLDQLIEKLKDARLEKDDSEGGDM